MIKMKKINIVLFWFLVIFIIQLAFGLKALGAQFELKNPINIRDDVQEIALIDNDTERFIDRLLILFVDGMRYDKMLQAATPNMDALRANGTTFANFQAVLPSYSRVNYAAFSAGTTTNITGVYANAHNKPLGLPTFFSLIDSNKMNKSLITSTDSWEDFLGSDADLLVKIEVEGTHTLKEGEKIMKAVNQTLPGNYSDIQVITFEDVDGAGHEYGAASVEYLQTIEKIDHYIGQILSLYKTLNRLENTTIILFSDHGHDDRGGHGDNIYDQMHATLILAGKGIKAKGVTINKKVRINAVIPTLLALTGTPLAPTMNGKILFENINISDKQKAIFAYQQAEIMYQQFNATLKKIKIFSTNTKARYQALGTFVRKDLRNALNNYSLNQFGNVFTSSQQAERSARILLSAVISHYTYLTRLYRTLTTIILTSILLLSIFLLDRKKLLPFTTRGIFTKKTLTPQIVSAVVTVLTAVLVFVIFGANFGATSYNSIKQAVSPILTAFLLSVIVAIFYPWLISWVIERRLKGQKIPFNELKETFVKGTIGSVFFVSLPIFGYLLYICTRYGAWPGATLPPLADSYAYMNISVFGAVLYLIPIIILIVQEIKKAKQNLSTKT
ncbi:MAG: alkaline phosphatase family protein [Candidatus Heimdallarchaeota archaeon]